MFWEVYQMGAINRASRRANEASSRSRKSEQRGRSVENDVRELQGRMDSLALGCQAMWELLCEHSSLTDTDILDRMQEVDLRDGTADGKMTSVVRQCPACDRPANPRRDKCLYCGEELSRGEKVFDQ